MNTPEIFIFSIEQLRLTAIGKRVSNQMVNRTFINGKEFTSREPVGTSSNFDDAEIVEENVIGASEENPGFLITHETEDPEEVLFQVVEMGLSSDGFNDEDRDG